MPSRRRTVGAEVFPVSPGQHKRRARRGWRRRDDAKARHKFCTSRFAWPEGTDAGSTSAAEGLQNLGFDGVLSSLSFAVERKGAAVGAAQGITDRHTSDIGHWFAMTGFAWSAMGGGTHGSRPTAIIFIGWACVPCRECGARPARAGQSPTPTDGLQISAGGPMWAPAPTDGFMINRCRGRCPHRPER